MGGDGAKKLKNWELPVASQMSLRVSGRKGSLFLAAILNILSFAPDQSGKELALSPLYNNFLATILLNVQKRVY